MGGVDTHKVLPWQPALVDRIQMAEGGNMLIRDSPQWSWAEHEQYDIILLKKNPKDY